SPWGLGECSVLDHRIGPVSGAAGGGEVAVAEHTAVVLVVVNQPGAELTDRVDLKVRDGVTRTSGEGDAVVRGVSARLCGLLFPEPAPLQNVAMCTRHETVSDVHPAALRSTVEAAGVAPVGEAGAVALVGQVLVTAVVVDHQPLVDVGCSCG